MSPEQTEPRSGPSPTSRTIARTVLATLGTLLLLIVVAETMAIAYSTRLGTKPVDVYRHVPYIGYLSLTSSPPDGSMGFTPTWGQQDDGERVWMLGGSALRDGYVRQGADQGSFPPVAVSIGDRSLPSALAKEANNHGRSLQVLNFGQFHFNFNQSRILFEEMLHRHPLPSVAVFYVGGNEVDLTEGIVGYPAMYGRTRDRLERRVLPVFLRNELARESFKLPFLVNYVFNRRVDPRSARAAIDRYDPFLAFEVANSEDTVVAAAIADSFAHNVRLLEGVCSEFGVRCFYYWQPLLCFKETRTPWEARVMEGALGGSDRHTICGRARLTRAAIQANTSLAGRDNVTDLSAIFAEVSAPIFSDMTHIDVAPDTGQLGHRTIAERLFSDIFSD